MWYVMQVRTGTEENICCQCSKLISGEILEGCFIPHYEAKKRYEGTWHTQEKVLFPGYVFMITDTVEKLFFDLKRVIGMTKIIGTGGEIVPISDQEREWLLKIGGQEQNVLMSKGVIENGKVRIIEGPLAGLENKIIKIDRHKRKALLQVEMFGRTMEIQVGVEIVEKD